MRPWTWGHLFCVRTQQLALRCYGTTTLVWALLLSRGVTATLSPLTPFAPPPRTLPALYCSHVSHRWPLSPFNVARVTEELNYSFSFISSRMATGGDGLAIASAGQGHSRIPWNNLLRCVDALFPLLCSSTGKLVQGHPECLVGAHL